MIVGDCMIIRYMDPWGRGGIIGNKIKGKDSNIHTSHTRNTETVRVIVLVSPLSRAQCS